MQGKSAPTTSAENGVHQSEGLIEMNAAGKTHSMPTFSSGMKISCYRSPVDKEILAELMQRNDLRGWVQTISHLGLFFTTGMLAYLVFLNIDTANWYWSVSLLPLRC